MIIRRRSNTSTSDASPLTVMTAPQPECTRIPIAAVFIGAAFRLPERVLLLLKVRRANNRVRKPALAVWATVAMFVLPDLPVGNQMIPGQEHFDKPGDDFRCWPLDGLVEARCNRRGFEIQLYCVGVCGLGVLNECRGRVNGS
jgi:hypothetical protein